MAWLKSKWKKDGEQSGVATPFVQTPSQNTAGTSTLGGDKPQSPQITRTFANTESESYKQAVPSTAQPAPSVAIAASVTPPIVPIPNTSPQPASPSMITSASLLQDHPLGQADDDPKKEEPMPVDAYERSPSRELDESDLNASDATPQGDEIGQANSGTRRAQSLNKVKQPRQNKAGNIHADGNAKVQVGDNYYQASDQCLADLRLTDPRDDKKRIEQTKGGLLRDSYRWILENGDFQKWRKDRETRLFWVKGNPGKGKTMLLCGIIDELKNPTIGNNLLSYFFCQGTDSRINNSTAVLRGLVYLLIVQQPTLISHIQKKYDIAGKRLFEDTNAWIALSDIFTSILRDPDLRPTYLIIDALDECVSGLAQLLNLIVQSVSNLPHVKWIVSGRNWPRIEEPLNKAGQKIRLSLELNADSVSDAVKKYIDFKVSKLPLQEDDERDKIRDTMLQKANGTFLWVALVIKELENPEILDALKTVEEMPSDLYELYDRMLNQSQNQSQKSNWEFCRPVLSTVTLAYRPLHLAELSVLSALPQNISSSTKKVRKIVAMCGSFLTIQDDYIYLIHQSVKDYLSGKASSTIFPSGPTDVHHAIFSRSLETISATLRRNIYGLQHLGLPIGKVKIPNPDPLAAVRYSCAHWARHFCDIYTNNRSQNRDDHDAISQFLRGYFLYWLEALGLIQHITDGVISITRLEKWLTKQSSNDQLLDLVQDSRRFILQNRWVIENTPLQTYESALIFSPANSLIRQLFEKEEPQWITVKPVVESAWSPCLQTLEGHSGKVKSVAFSPDSKRLASGSDDKTIKIWDAATGALQHTLEGHSDWVRSVAFSPDSKRLASGSNDKTIKIWDAATGTLQHTLEGHSNWVRSVTFSPDSKRLASGSYKTTKIWDAATGALQHTFDVGTTVDTISFDNTGSYLDTDIGRIELSGIKPQKEIQGLPQEAKRYTYSLSSDESWITWSKNNVLWLPLDYRPYASAISPSTSLSTPSTDVTMALGSRSGKVVVIGLSGSGPSPL